jgi:proline iminopeptidase
MPQKKRKTVHKGNAEMKTGQLTTADGVRLFFQTLGNSPQTLVIPNGMYMLDDFQRLANHHTLIFYDLRNRGRSDAVSDSAKLKRGILNDVKDLEAVRGHFGIAKLKLIGHSYVGMAVVLYAMQYPGHVDRVVQIGPAQPDQGKQYPAHLTNTDETLREVFAQLGELQKKRGTEGPVEFCRKFWSVLRAIYVANPADASKIDWGRCDLPNELNSMKYWTESIFPSMQNLHLTADELAKADMPVLTIHGKKDRSAPYGGGREWALLLPNARLLTVDNAAHAPWIEAPELVLGAMHTFLNGSWPDAAEKVASLEPQS